MIGLTPHQTKLLRFIRGYQLAHGFSPCLREMAEGIGVRSKHTVHQILEGLEDRGAIRRLPNKVRAVEALVDIPVPHAPDGAALFAVRGDW